jgi:hypothetical protein
LPIKARSFKSKAKLDLIAELDPDGTKNVETKEQIIERANKMYSEDKSNEAKAEAQANKMQELHYPKKRL